MVTCWKAFIKNVIENQYTCNPALWIVEAERSRVQDQPLLHSEFKVCLAYMRPCPTTLKLWSLNWGLKND